MSFPENLFPTCNLPEDAVEVGRVLGASGIKGDLRIQSHSASGQSMMSVKTWYLLPPASSNAYCARVTKILLRTKFLVGGLDGIDDRNQAESMAGTRIFMARKDFPKTGDDEYYWIDLLNLTVVNQEGFILGTITDLFYAGGQTTLVVTPRQEDPKAKDPPKECLIPFVSAFVIDVNLTERRVTVDWYWDYSR